MQQPDALQNLHLFVSFSFMNVLFQTMWLFPACSLLARSQAIAVGKVKAVEDAIALCFALKQEVGSYALMAGSGFEQMDFLQCCKFAEGDSRILMQKMARDIVRAKRGEGAGETKALAELQVCQNCQTRC